MALEATTRVQFNEGSVDTNAIFNITPDDVLNVDDEGNIISTVYPGESFFYWVNHSPNLVITEVVCTHGSIVQLGTVVRGITENKLFASRAHDEEDRDEYNVPVIPTAVVDTALGRTYREIETEVDEVTRAQTKRIVPVFSAPVMVSFETTFQALSYRFTAPALNLAEDEKYPIGIVFYVSDTSLEIT